MKSYGLGVFISVLAHSLLVVFVIWGWQAASPQKKIETPRYVKATLIELEQKAKPAVDVNKKKREEEARKKKEQQRKLAEKKKREQEKAKQLALKKAKEEKARKEKEKKEKERKDKERKEKEERERKEKERKEELLKEIEKEKERKRKQELEDAIAAEKARQAAAKQASEDERLIASYNSIIREKVSANWSRPPSARNGMVVTLKIQLVPTGEVISVEIIGSSGDVAFDRSAVRAVKKAARFSEIKEMKSRFFEQYYRTFNINFSPEDLRQ